MKMISNIVFTKNRPLQLDGYLESLYRHFPAELIQTYVLYKQELFAEQYQQLFSKYPDCLVVKENDFQSDLLKIINQVDAMLNQFKEIFSIELSRILFEKAKKKFSSYSYSHVHIMCGQSGELLPEILRNVMQPCIFWLDAHWSGGSTAKGELETPIIQELKCILNHRNAENHVLLIDDARCFTGENDYPTLHVLKNFIRKIHPDWIFEVKDDIIRIHSDNLAI
jgi:hypothetical protein